MKKILWINFKGYVTRISWMTQSIMRGESNFNLIFSRFFPWHLQTWHLKEEKEEEEDRGKQHHETTQEPNDRRRNIVTKTEETKKERIRMTKKRREEQTFVAWLTSIPSLIRLQTKEWYPKVLTKTINPLAKPVTFDTKRYSVKHVCDLIHEDNKYHLPSCSCSQWCHRFSSGCPDQVLNEQITKKFEGQKSWVRKIVSRCWLNWQVNDETRDRKFLWKQLSVTANWASDDWINNHR